MSRASPTVFPSSEFLDVDLLVELRTDDRSCDRRARNGGGTQHHSVIATDGRTFSNVMFSPSGDIAIIDVDFHAWLDAVLATAVDDDGVHISISFWM